LLTTFTACVTLADANALDEVSLPAARKYVTSMQHADGGFCGFEFDPAHDVEYTFYGLGSLALFEAG